MVAGKDATRKDSLMRRPIAALAIAALSLVLAAPASAKHLPDPASFAFAATIDCGTGPVDVGSTEDLYAPLVNLATGKKYSPVAWDVSAGDFHFVDAIKGATKKHAVDCSYVDEWVSGTVTLKKF
jgi:hypothetical protein